jgi:hypothetical protein
MLRKATGGGRRETRQRTGEVVSAFAGTRTNSAMFYSFIDATFGVPSTTNVSIGLPSRRFFQTTRNVS